MWLPWACMCSFWESLAGLSGTHNLLLPLVHVCGTASSLVLTATSCSALFCTLWPLDIQSMWAPHQHPTSGETDTIPLSSHVKSRHTRGMFYSPSSISRERSLELCAFSRSCQVVLATGCHPSFSLVSAAFRYPHYASSFSAPNAVPQKPVLRAVLHRDGMLDPLSTPLSPSWRKSQRLGCSCLVLSCDSLGGGLTWGKWNCFSYPFQCSCF